MFMNRLKEHSILEHRTRLFLVTNVMNVNNFLLLYKNQGTDFLTFCTSKVRKNQMIFPRGEISCQSKLDSGQMNVLKCINSISSWLSTSGRVNWSPGTWFFCNDVRMMDIMMCTSSLIMLKVLEFRSTHPKTYSARPILILWNIQSCNSLQARHYRIKPTVSQTRNLIVQWPKANKKDELLLVHFFDDDRSDIFINDI